MTEAFPRLQTTFYLSLLILAFLSVHYSTASPQHCGLLAVGLPCAPDSGDLKPAILIIHT